VLVVLDAEDTVVAPLPNAPLDEASDVVAPSIVVDVPEAPPEAPPRKAS